MKKSRKEQLEIIEKIAKETDDKQLLKTVKERKENKTIIKDE